MDLPTTYGQTGIKFDPIGRTGLPCAWPKCPEFYLPLPDKQRALFDTNPIPPLKTPDAEYKRITAYVSKMAQERYDMPRLLYRWVRQET